MISIIVPVYNIENYVKRCIDSILRQSFTDFELILVNDGSTDTSQQICEQFAREDSRIILINKVNGGLSDARNRGTSKASGEWITYIDGDDYIHVDYLKVLIALCKQANAEIAVVQPLIVNETEAAKNNYFDLHQYSCLSGYEATLEIVHYNKMSMISAWGKLYHCSLKELLQYPLNKLHEDEFITYKLFYHAKNVAVSNYPLYYYVMRQDSITRKAYSKRRLDKVEALYEATHYFEALHEVELSEYAWLRYILNIQIAWYRVKTSSVISDKKELLPKMH